MRQARKLLPAYGVATVAVMMTERLQRGSVISAYLKYAVMLSLVLLVLAAYKEKKTGLLPAAAFVFMAAGDFFLVLSPVLPFDIDGSQCLGALCFVFAYGCMIRFYTSQQISLRRTKTAAVLFIVSAGVFLLNILTAAWPLGVPLYLGLVIFWSVITCMVLLSHAQLRPHIAASRALFASAILMYLCDSCVAFNYLHPGMPFLYPLMKDLTWLAYIPGWTLLAVSATGGLLNPSKESGVPDQVLL
jgi:hypothetical protein